MKVTRDVVSDLWPLYVAGEASADTRQLIDVFLETDREFGERLKATGSLPTPDVPRTPDAEIAALKRTRDLLYGRSWLRGLRLCALVLTIFAITRAITEINWSTTPLLFLTEGIIATALWTAYAVLLRRYRVQSLRTPRG
jgi:hypothetical protein